jgi:tetratricopeptide (TPR) repeat protein
LNGGAERWGYDGAHGFRSLVVVQPHQDKEADMARSSIHAARGALPAMLLALLLLIPMPAIFIPAAAAAEEKLVHLRGDPAAEATEREGLFTALVTAKNAAEAAGVTEKIWSFWFRAPNEEAAAQMEQVIDLRVARDFAGAMAILDKLVESQPEWAEVWNQRATIRYIVRDYDGSLADIDRVLALEPKHFGALSGQAIILMHQGRMAEGQAALKRAVEIDPFLSERALLMKPPGQDI